MPSPERVRCFFRSSSSFLKDEVGLANEEALREGGTSPLPEEVEAGRESVRAAILGSRDGIEGEKRGTKVGVRFWGGGLRGGKEKGINVTSEEARPRADGSIPSDLLPFLTSRSFSLSRS